MPGFSVDGITPLMSVPPGGRVHIIGVCGVAMAQLAVMLSQRGFAVSGSDKEFYEPMSSLLSQSQIACQRGYSVDHITSQIDLVVIGNSVVESNPEVQRSRELGLCYSIFPRLLREVVIGERRSIVIAGTHGKSTTTALGAFTFQKLNLDPSYFIGGAVPNLGHSLHVGGGALSIVEGDEYDCSFFAKVPKFSFYDPEILVITSIEFDHADIYPNLESIYAVFSKQVKSIPSTGHVVICVDDPNCKKLLAQWKKEAICRFVTYGFDSSADYRVIDVQAHGQQQQVRIQAEDQEYSFSMAIPGAFNAANAVAVLCVGRILGIEMTQLTRYFSLFHGVKRRQEVRFDGPITLLEDFAHHPTAVRQTLTGLKASYPNRRLIAVFEPRSNTSRRKVFQSSYQKAFSSADEALLCQVQARATDSSDDLLDVQDLASCIDATGVRCRALASPDAIEALLKTELRDGDVLVLMSNGSFGGLAHRIEDLLRQRYSS